MNIITFCQFGPNHSCDSYFQGKKNIGVSFGTKIKSNVFCFFKAKVALNGNILFCLKYSAGPNIKSKESKRKEDFSVKSRSPVGANPVTSSRFTVSPANDPHLV